MESTRRPFDRSLSKEPGLKKPRLSQDSADRGVSNGRAGFVQRPVAVAAGGIGSRLQRDRDSDAVVRGVSYQDRNQELVNQYKTALAELTFNSKPIITNLTIIAGENVVAAKAIAATICTNILEVPSEQKLPSLYLLDSIVKNIGKDYIKYFAPRLPEVFCEAYRQVDPSVHQGMRHLFGTWKGVFPPQSLQMIEKELGFTTTVNGSSTGTSRLDSQVQRPAQSIHVNPKYLEARQRLQSTRARGAGSDVNGALVNSHEDTQAQGPTSISSERSWPDPYAKVKQDFSTRANGVSRSWKNSEEEEYMWDDMNSRPTNKTLDFGSHIGRPYNMHDIGSRIGDNASADSSSTELSHVAPGTRASLSWSQELHPSDERMFSGSGKNSSGNSEGYSSGWENSENHVGRTSFQPQLGPAHIEAPVKFSTNVMPGPKVSVTQQRQAFGAAPSSTKASINHRPPPSFAARSLNQLPTTSSERNQVSTGPPTDPRRALALRNTGSRDQFSHDSLPPPSQDVYQANTQRLQPQSLRTSSSVPSRQRLQPQSMQTSSSVLPPLLQTKNVPYTEQRKVDVTEFKSFGEGRSLLPSQISRPESLSIMGNSSSDQSNPLSVDSPEQSITSSLLAAVVKSGVLGDTALTGSSTKVESLEVGSGLPLGGMQLSLPSGSPTNISSPSALPGMGLLPGLSQKKLEQQPLQTGPAPSSLTGIVLGQTASVVNTNSIPVSSLLSTLVAKGLILSSNSESLGSVSTRKPDQPLDRDPGVTSTSSSPVTSVAKKPLLSIKEEPSSFEPAAKACESLSESITEIKNLIGFEFRPNIVRNLHPEVVDDLLSELPYNCSMCGLRLKLQEQLDRHMEWHELKAPQRSPSAAISRSWYINADDWVEGVGQFPSNSPSDLLVESDETSETSVEMVPADESQCACILCGELFEDFYSLERNEWMFKGAVYLTIPSSESHEITGIRNDSVSLNPIVHAICMKEDSVRDLRKAYDVKLENEEA